MFWQRATRAPTAIGLLWKSGRSPRCSLCLTVTRWAQIQHPLGKRTKRYDLAIPSFRTHPLKGDLAGHWSIWVNGNWRVTFRFVETDVELVDYRDYH